MSNYRLVTRSLCLTSDIRVLLLANINDCHTVVLAFFVREYSLYLLQCLICIKMCSSTISSLMFVLVHQIIHENIFCLDINYLYSKCSLNNKLKFINSEMKCGHALGQYADLEEIGDSWVCLDEA
ncbi:hypothetical protein V1477_001584 [Vespula maculifrons]|uniref:Uncharacterized protein n=1 Tax=Vespula maculifrons TaxID=7453 RepID=A0ABD2CY65_VESMC